MTEELISTLSRIRDLKVISRTSVLRYEQTTKSLSEIAKELNVGALLEGSVRKIGDDLRITAQLIDVQNDEHLWYGEYRRALDLNPSLVDGHLELSSLLMYVRRFHEAALESKRALELDPLSASTYVYAGGWLFNSRRYDDAIEVLKKCPRTRPIFRFCTGQSGLFLRRKGNVRGRNSRNQKIH